MAWVTAAACPVLGIATGVSFILQVTMDVGIAATLHGVCTDYLIPAPPILETPQQPTMSRPPVSATLVTMEMAGGAIRGRIIQWGHRPNPPTTGLA